MAHRTSLIMGLALAGCGGQAVVDGSADSRGVDGGTGGMGGHSSCDAIAAAYGTALAQARRCDPLLSSPQCTLSFRSALNCGCPTYVNPDNAEALETLGALETQWQTMGCDLPVPCPNCPAPQGSTCVQGSSGDGSGSCQDRFL